MKKIILLALFVVFSGGVANAQVFEVEVSQRIVDVLVDISTTKVKLSDAGYEAPVLKVLVPELADVTIMDHRNEGESAPCLATYDTLNIEEVVQGDPSIERVPLTITLSKLLSKDPENKLCHVMLAERIDGEIRGFNFNHLRQIPVGTRHIDDCR